MSISLWQANGEQAVRDVDFLIVGAGLVGCSAAYFASQQGRDVVITDVRDVGMGASGRNAGFMITGLDTYYHHAIDQYGIDRTRELWNLSKTTHGHLSHFIKQGEVPVRETGSLLLAESEAEAQDLELAARAMDADRLEFEYTSDDPLNRGYYAAIRQKHDAAVQPYKLTQAIFQQSGVELIANNEVYGLARDGDTVIVTSHRFVFRARTVLLCTNAYSPRLHPYFIGKVVPTRAQVLVTAPLDKPILDECGYSDYGYMYYRETFDGRLLLGGARKNHKAEENDTTDDRITDSVQNALEQYLHERFPEVTAPIERRWSGIMGFSSDGIPLVGKLPDMPQIGFAVGFTGHGLAMGAGSAERAVDMLLHGTHPGVVSIDRFD